MQPELENLEEIKQLLSSELTAKRDEGTGKALLNVTLGIVNTRLALHSLVGSFGRVRDELVKLNENLKKADESSASLTKALNKITLAGVIVAGIGILIGLLSLGLEFYKIFIL
jgi:hypothetical protein